MIRNVASRFSGRWANAVVSFVGTHISPSPLPLFFVLMMALTALGLAPAQSQTQTVASWGANGNGQLGNNSKTDYETSPVDITSSGALKGKVVIQLVAGSNHSLAVCSDGTLAAWGEGFDGQLGDGSNISQGLPLNITGKGALAGKKVIYAAAGVNHSLALCSDGTVAAWGQNVKGELGDGTTVQRSQPVAITNSGALKGKTVRRLAAGFTHSLALCSDGTLVAWGDNRTGQLGNGTTTTQPVPVAITGGALSGKTVSQIATSFEHSLALCSDGTVAAWGSNSSGALGDVDTTNHLLPFAITRQGALNGRRVKTLIAREFHSLALCTDGTVVGWGKNESGRLGDNSANYYILPTAITGGALSGKTVTQLVGSEIHALALCSDQSLVGWGYNGAGALGNGTTTTSPLPTTIPLQGALKGKTITNMVAAGGHTLALATGTAVPANQPPSVTTGVATNITSSSATLSATFNPNGLSTSATLEYGPTTFYGKSAPVVLTPNNGTATQSVSVDILGLTPSTTYHFRAKAINSVGKTNGSDVTFTTSPSIPPEVSPMLVAWGFNDQGQVGDGTNIQRPLPVHVTGQGALAGKTVVQIAAGDYHSLALCSDGTLATWGYNGWGQLGDGTNIYRFIPVNITAQGALKGKSVIQISGGALHNVALCSDGTIAAWGDNEYGQLGDGTTTNSFVPIAITNKGALSGKTVIQLVAGDYHNLALCSDGTVVTWGLNNIGQLGDGTMLTYRALPVDITNNGVLSGRTVTQLVGGDTFSFALCSDGTVAAWGRDQSAQLGDGGLGNYNLPKLTLNRGVLEGKKVAQITTGFEYGLALCTDGTVVAWGDNKNGQLGDGSTSQRFSPVNITSSGVLKGRRVTMLAASFCHSLAICSDGTIAAWGDNVSGQLGDGTTIERHLPIAIRDKGVLKGNTVTQIVAGRYHTIALTTPGEIPANQPPTITILTPTPSQTLSLSEFTGNTISGSATDDGGVTSVTVKLYRTRNGVNQIWNGSAFTTLSRTVSAETSGSGTNITWKMGAQTPPPSQLDGGEYQVIVYASDATGLTATTRSSFTLTVPIPTTDVEKPVVTVNTPTPNQTLKLSGFISGTLSGSATDNVGVASVIVKLYRTRSGVNQIWNGSAFTTLSRTVPAQVSGAGTNITWSLGEKVPPQNLLDAGEYQVIVYATDAAGNIGQARSTFTLEVPPSPTDTEKPVISISAPTAGQSLLTSSIVAGFIQGQASDNVGVLKVDLKLYRNRGGVNQIWNGTSFSTTVATVPAELTGPTTGAAWSLGTKTPPQNLLDAGEYQLIAYATDAAGNTSATRTTFTLAVSGSSS